MTEIFDKNRYNGQVGNCNVSVGRYNNKEVFNDNNDTAVEEVDEDDDSDDNDDDKDMEGNSRIDSGRPLLR